MTLRNPNLKTELAGVRYIQGVVQNNHSIFHPFTRENDQGNDCYIEFVKDGIAMNYGVFAHFRTKELISFSLYTRRHLKETYEITFSNLLSIIQTLFLIQFIY